MKVRNLAVVLICIIAMLSGCGRENTGPLPPPGLIVGTVSDKDSGSPIDSALVSARVGPDTTDNLLAAGMTDTNGSYRLYAGCYEGDVYVSAEKEGFVSEMSDAYLKKYIKVVVNFELEKE